MAHIRLAIALCLPRPISEWFLDLKAMLFKTQQAC